MSAKRILAPWRGERSELSPFGSLQREINRAFDDLWGGFDLAPLGRGALFGELGPSVDVSEDDKEVRVTADLPGLDEKDIEVELSDDRLTIKGEKHEEREEKKRSYHLRERAFGSFQRAILLPTGVDAGKTKAAFEKGVLTVTIPKTEAARKVKKVEIKAK